MTCRLNSASQQFAAGVILRIVFRRNLLIFHQAALGDFIVTWPLAMALSRIFPQSRVIYVTHSQKGALAERVLRVESTDGEAGWHALFADGPPQLPPLAAKLLAGAHTIVNFTGPVREKFAVVAPNANVICLDTNLLGSGHVTESLVQQLSDSPAIAAAMEQMLKAVAFRGVGYHPVADGRIVIHPGAGKERNRWPAERFLELVAQLRGAGKRVVVLLGEVELERWPAELVARFESAAEVRRPANLLVLLDEITAADAFIGNDSGPAHLAGIVGVPTVCLFGRDEPHRWRPLGPRVSVIQRDPVAAIDVEQAYTEIARMIGGQQ